MQKKKKISEGLSSLCLKVKCSVRGRGQVENAIFQCSRWFLLML